MASESALVVLVPEAEAVVWRLRARHVRSAALGMPAHITVLYPFKPPEEIGARVLEDLAACAARFPAFRFTLRELRRFTGVLYLAPDPDEPFRRLTLGIWECFPESPPYGGRIADIVPHLTVADIWTNDGLDEIATEFARSARGRLPIAGRANALALMDNVSGRWQVRSTVALGR
jgi:2'-5' RNA ligase